MAGNKQLRIDLDVYANTTKAKKEIESLSESLNHLGANINLAPDLAQSIRNQKGAVNKELSDLQAALKNSLSVDTGKLDFSKFSQQIKRYGLDIQSVGNTLKNMGYEGEKAFFQLSTAIAKSEIPTKKLSDGFLALQKTFFNTVRWQVTAKAINSVTEGLAAAYNYAQKLDRSLNNIRIVTGYSADKMAIFADEANRAARELSASTVAYTDAALIFYQQGLDDKAVKERTDATIKMANVTGEMAKNVSSYMTAIWNNFADGSQTLEYYADVITALGAATAASSEEIAAGMEKFAAVGKTVGLSYEYASAAVATVVDKTRVSADVVGTSFKTLFARLEGLSLGETLEDGTNLNKYSQALASVGVNIKDQTGQLKQMDQILDELGEKWALLNDDQKVALAQTVGGVRQYTQLISLMENYDAFKENIEIASDSEGTLNKQQRIFEESWKGHQRRLQASSEALYSDILDDKAFKDLLDALTKIVDMTDGLLDTLGGVYKVIAQIVPLVIRLNQEKFITGVNNAAYNISGFFGSNKRLEEERNKTREQLLQSGGVGLTQTSQNKQKIELDILSLQEKYKGRISDEELQTLDYLKQQLQTEQDLLEIEKQRILEETNKLRPSKNAAKGQESEYLSNSVYKKEYAAARDVNAGIGLFGELLESEKVPYQESVDKAKEYYQTYLSNNIAVDTEAKQNMAGQLDVIAKISKQFQKGKISDDEAVTDIQNAFNEIINILNNALERYYNRLEGQIEKELTEQAYDKAYSEAKQQWEKTKNVGSREDFIDNNAESLYTAVTSGSNNLRSTERLIKEDLFTHTEVSDKGALNDQFWSDLNNNPTLRNSLPLTSLMMPQRAKDLGLISSNLLDDFNGLRGANEEGTHRSFKKLFGLLDATGFSTEAFDKVTLDQLMADSTLPGKTIEEKFANYVKKILAEVRSAMDEAVDEAYQEAQGNPEVAFEEKAKKAADKVVEEGKVGIERRVLETTAREVGTVNAQSTYLNDQRRENADRIRQSFDPTSIREELEKRAGQANLGQKLYGLTQTFTSLNAITQSLVNTFEIWGDESASLGQKLEATFSTFLSTGSQIAMMANNPALSAGVGSIASALGTTLPVLLGSGAVIAAVAGVALGAYKIAENNISKEIQKNQAQITENIDWVEQHKEALKSVEAYQEAKQAIDETEESLDGYHQQLVETAEALEIQNVALLEQANAWGLLEESINKTSEALNNEALQKANQNFELAQAQVNLGVQKDNLLANVLTLGLNRDYIDKFQSVGVDKEEGEARFLRELAELGLSGVSVGERGYTIDLDQMSEGEKAEFFRFAANAQNNSALYGGDSNELIKGLNEISDDLGAIADGLEESLKTIVLANYRSQGDLNTTSNITSYGERYEQLYNEMQSIYGATSEQAIEYTNQIMSEFNDAKLAAQYSVVRGYAEATHQDVQGVTASVGAYSPENQEILIRAMGANAAATRAIINAYQDEEAEIEHLQALIDSVDASTLTQSLEAIQEFISKLKTGAVFNENEIETLASQMGYNSAEQFLEAFGDVFSDVANGKYVFTGTAEALTSRVDSELANRIMTAADSGVTFEELNIGGYEDLLAASENYTNTINNLVTTRDDIAAAVDYYEANGQVMVGGYAGDTQEGVARAFLGYEAGTELTEGQQLAVDTVISSGTIVPVVDENGQTIGYRVSSENFDSISGQTWNDYINGTINDMQAGYDQNQLDLEALSWVNDYQEKYDKYQLGDYTAFEDDLVTAYTTMEQLQELNEKGFISEEKYLASLDNAAINEANLWGISTEELAKHAEVLEENNEYLLDNHEEAMAVALANERANIALEDLYKNMDNYNEILVAGRRDSEQWTDTIEALGHDLQNMFNYDETVSEDFILENLTDIQAAANGDIDAVNRLQVVFAQMRVSEEDAALGMDNIWNEINAIDWDNLEIGVTMDTVPAMESLAQLMIQAGLSADAIRDTFNALGWEADIQTTPTTGPNGETIEVVTGIVPKNSHYVGTNKRGLNAKTDKSKKGKSSKKDEKEFRDEFERYYKITRQIKDQQDATERLNKAKERAFGKAKLDYLDQEADSMQREIDLQKEYLDEIRGYYASDKGNLEAFGATFDENGVLTNYEQLINSELARYNQAVEAYNANQDEAAFESAEKRFNYFKDVLKQYDETNQLYQEQLDNLTDMQNKWYDMALQKTQLKVEMEIAIDDRDLEFLEYALDRIEKKAFATAEALAKITQSVGDTLDKQKIYQDALEEILSRHGINGIDAVNSLSDEQIANLGFTQDEIDAIVEYNSNLLDTQKEMDKLQDEILNGPLKAFKEWNEEFDYQEDKIQRNIDLLNQYKNIADLIYSNSSAVGQEYIMSLMTNTYDSMVLGVDAARLELRANQEALEKAKQSYEEAIANGAGEETLNTLKKNLREMEKAVEDSEDDMLKKTEEALKQAEELFKAMIENAKNSFKELTSVTDWDMTQFDRLKSLDDEYLDDYAKIYEFAKLTRDINNSIDDTDTIRGKERLREITQEIADIEAQGKEVSQYEVDALRAKYELRLAEIALEDAQNAKSVVRMNRDNEGNWSYVYTADEDNVDKARQNYEDKLYEYQKLNSEFIKNQQENFLKLEQEYTDAMQKIAEDSSLSREDKEARLQETQAYYQRMAEIMSDQLGIALSKNSELYNKDWLDYSKNTGYKISMEEEYQTKLDDTYTGHLQPNIDSATQLLAQFTESATGDGGYLPTIINALDDFEVRQDEVLQAAGTSLMTYADDMQRTAEDIETTMDDAAAGLVEDFDTIMAKMSEINAASFDGLRNSITDAISSVNDLVAAYERLSNAASAAQNSSVSASGGGMRDFSSDGARGGNGGSGLRGTISSNTGSNGDNNRTSNQKAADFLWYFYTKKDTPYGSGMWAGIKQQMYTLSRDTNDLIGYLTNPRNNIQSAETIQQYIERNRLNLGSFRNWAKQNFAQVYAANAFDTGGYTGAWGTEGRLAFLHQKELVLNADDTENMLNIVKMVRDITSAIDTRASMASVANINNGMYGSVGAGAQALDQNVHIEANFPNVTDHNEIEMALSNLVNQAAQYANRKS